MKKKIYVQLESPWKYTSGGMGNSILNNPPKNVKYIFKNNKRIISDVKEISKINRIKKFIFNLSYVLPIVKSRKVKILNKNVNLIHAEHFLCKNKNIPWVADFEGFWQFFIGKRTKLKKMKIEKILSRKNCKKIIFWTESARKSAIKEFPDLKDKFGVVHPSIPLSKIKRKKHAELNLVFVARYFYAKGGLHALEVMDRLTKKYPNVQGILVSEIPEEVKKRYSKNKKIKFYNLMPQNELIKKVYSISDIFVYPGYSDSFGFAIPEVMSMGIPVVSVDVSTRREIISDGKNGFVINNNLSQLELRKRSYNLDEDLINRMKEKCKLLIENKKLRNTFGRNAKKEIVSGKFSAKKISKKIEQIYEEAIK